MKTLVYHFLGVISVQLRIRRAGVRTENTYYVPEFVQQQERVKIRAAETSRLAWGSSPIRATLPPALH